MNYLFSIIIPCYNAQTTIIRTLQSCFDQTYQNFDIIIVDDCSTDNSVKIIKNLNNNKIKLVQLPVNSGPSFARNTGWDLAQGDYVAFLDADDVWHQEKLEIINKTLNTQNVDFLGHGFSVRDFDFSTIKPTELPVFIRYHYFKLMMINVTSTPCVVIKRNIRERFNLGMKYCEDQDLWVRLALIYGFYFSNQKLTTLDRPILSAGGLSSSRWKMRQGELQMYYNIAKIRKWFFVLMPFLFVFSMLKHFVNMFTTLPSNRVIENKKGK